MASLDMSKNLEGFLKTLENQYKYLSNGGTKYRVETAKLSLLVAKKVLKLEPFLNRQRTHNLVKELFVNVNDDRVNDVAKMLYLNAMDQVRKSNVSPEFRDAVNDRMKKRQALKLVKQ